MAQKPAPRFDDIKDDYTRLLAVADVRPGARARIDAAARRIIANRARYEVVGAPLGVPWAFIGCLHYRESNLNFKTHLHNGDSLARRTVQEPPGRPSAGTPPFTWEESAIDALKIKGLHRAIGWEPEQVCFRTEAFNGFGYRLYHPEVNSPYLWSGTDEYIRGKYTSDGGPGWSQSTVDAQLGVIPIYQRILELTSVRETINSSRKLRGLERVVIGVKALLGTVGGLFTAGTLGHLKEWFSLSTIKPEVLVALALSGILVWVLVNWLMKLSLEDAKEGRWAPSGQTKPTAEGGPGDPV